MIPRSDRLLVEEVSIWQPPPGTSRRSISDVSYGLPSSESLPMHNRVANLKDQKTTRRLSDLITGNRNDQRQPSTGSKKDLWLIRFTDVIIRCQRVGFTSMPLGAVSTRSKAKNGDRNLIPGRKRNLYKFDRVERWEMREAPSLSAHRPGVVSVGTQFAQALLSADSPIPDGRYSPTSLTRPR